MQIIDTKGRLFHRINLFDLVIIIFIILVFSFLLINIFFSGRMHKKISDVPELEYVNVDMILREDLTWMKKHIRVGDVLPGLFYGKVSAEIVGIKEVTGFGSNKRLMVTIKAYVSKDKMGALSFGKHYLKIGSEISFYTQEYFFTGNIVNIRMTGEKLKLGD